MQALSQVSSGKTQISLDHISQLDFYAKQLLSLADEFRDSVQVVNQQFEIRTQGSKGEAIKAFLNKYQTLEKQFLTRFPEVLEAYAASILTYVSAVETIGFEEKVYSSTMGMEYVQDLVRREQVAIMNAVAQSLDGAIQLAEDALGYSLGGVQPLVTQAEKELIEVARQTETIHLQVSEAYTAFKAALEEQHLPDLQRLQTGLHQLKEVVQIPIKTIVSAIQSETLEVSEMYYFDHIHSVADREALITLLSDDPSSLVDMDVDKVSPEMGMILVDEISDWLDGVDVGDERHYPHYPKISKLLNRFGQLPEEKSKAMMDYFLQASEAQSMLLNTSIVSEVDQTGKMSPLGSKLRNKITLTNELTGILLLMKEHRVWSYESNNYSSMTYYTHHHSVDLSLRKKGNALQIDLHRKGTQQTFKTEHYELELVPGEMVGIEKVQKEIVDLHREREEAGNQFFLHTVGKVASSITDLFPGASATLDLITSLASDDGVGVAQSAWDLVPGKEQWAQGSRTRGVLAAAPDKLLPIVGEYLQYQNKLSEIDEKEVKAYQSLVETLGNHGAHKFATVNEKGEEIQVNLSSYYYNDPGFLLRLQYLDTYGVTEMYEDSEYSVKKLSEKLGNAKVRQDIIEYLLFPEKSNLSMQKMSQDQLKNLVNGIDKLPDPNQDDNESNEMTGSAEVIRFITDKYQDLH